MKKILAIVLALTMLVCFAACGDKTETNATPSEAETTAAEESTGSEEETTDAIVEEETTEAVVEEETTVPAEDTADALDIHTIIGKLYEANPVEFPADTYGMDLELTDADMIKMFTGLDDASLIKEAVFSESMIGAQPYSLVIVRAADGADVEAIKTAMFNGINTRKWVCVEADQLTVASTGDLVILCMVGSTLIADFDTTMVNSFADIAGALTGETLTK